ncbi:hypothetical protein J3459_006140 [Metarhizium acridum]|nr:hypothetical protein J3459_006214 [Metarhizium acridum]KAG8428009.1 hypothetical protein J3459_006140 [Metarhizium acridum]
MASSSSQPPMRPIDPQPMPSPSNAPYFPPPPPGPGQGLGLQLGPDSQIPDHPGSTTPAPVPLDICNVKASARFHLREFLRARSQLQQGGGAARFELESRLRSQVGMALGDLSTLQAEVRALAQAAENHRWRRFLLGGAIAAFIPAVRKIFRRNSDEESRLSSNDTEYAFRKSKGLLSGMKSAILGGGMLAKVAFFVFAILYVFQNEVTIRVAKTLNKRLRKLTERIEGGDADLDESDLRMFDGWRWRVLLW